MGHEVDFLSQATKALFASKTVTHEEDTVGYFNTNLEAVRDGLAAGLESPDAAIEFTRLSGAGIYQRLAELSPKADLPGFASPEEVPENLALASLVNLHHGFLGNVDTLRLLLLAVPWLARRRPEDFYYPAAARRFSSRSTGEEGDATGALAPPCAARYIPRGGDSDGFQRHPQARQIHLLGLPRLARR